jgi:hypothetical protein
MHTKLQKEIDKAAEEMCHITQDKQGRRPQQRELRQESPSYDDVWYDDFKHGNFAFDDASRLAAEFMLPMATFVQTATIPHV